MIMLALAVGLGVLGYYTLFNNKTPEAGKRSSSDGKKDQDDNMKQKVLTFTIDGKTPKGVKQWHLEGTTAEMIGDEINLENLDAIAYGDGFTATLKSDSGIYRRAKSEVELLGNVNVVAEDGTVLKTDKAKWSQETKDITTDSVVHIVRQNMKATGTGAMANSFSKKATLKKDVTVRLEPATTIKSDGSLAVNFNENRAVFSDNVRVHDKDGDLTSDLLTVYFDPETKKIAEVVAEGNVKLTRGHSYTLCEKATYTDGTASVKFVGKPRVVIAPEELSGTGFLSGEGGLSQMMGKDRGTENSATAKEPKKTGAADMLSVVNNLSNS